jgi:hypothetical protein
MRRAIFGQRARCSSHSHIRALRHPACRSLRATVLSRATLLSNFRIQKFSRLFGVYANLQPEWRCQKHPSTNTAIFSRGNTKSGLPNTRELRRQPVIRYSRNREISRNSVSRFPRARIRDITCDLFSRVKTSATMFSRSALVSPLSPSQPHAPCAAEPRCPLV